MDRIRRNRNLIPSLSRTLGVVFLVITTGCATPAPPSAGAEVFNRYCATCHQADASGVPGAYPPLRENEWVQGDPGRLIRLLLFGMQGPVVVKGESYNNAMPPHAFLSDAQIAAVLTHVRSKYGNQADSVDAAWVTRIRAAEQRDRAWHPTELEAAVGIP